MRGSKAACAALDAPKGVGLWPPQVARPPWGGGPAASDLTSTPGTGDDLADARAISKLKWRCRRGLLENDLFIARFFERHESRLTVGQASAMETLMDLSDNDLLDLLLARKEPERELGANTAVLALLHLMRTDGAQRAPSSRTSIFERKSQ